MPIVENFGKATGFAMPSFSGMTMYVVVFLLIVVFGAIFIGGFYAYWTHKKYNKNIPVFSIVGARCQLIGEDTAMFQRVGDAGDFWCITKKWKKILPMPTIQMAPNTYWHFVREDGEWVNFGLGDIDKQMKSAGAYYIHEDMRLQRLGIQKNLRERLQQKNWWEKYGTTLVFFVVIIIIIILMIVLFKYQKDALAGAYEMAEAVKNMAVQIENLGRGIGGGVIPAG